MKDSGCRGVYLGIESASGQSLEEHEQACHREQYARGVHLLNKYDIPYLAAFVLGFAAEPATTIQENIDFIRNNGVRFIR